MIVLDINALCEPLRANPEQAELDRIAEHADMATAAVIVAELFAGTRSLSPATRNIEDFEAER